MTETFLDGRLTLGSLAVPSDEDVAKIAALPDEDYRAFRSQVRARRKSSPISDATVDEVWDRAVKAVQSVHDKQRRAL
ncbi:hypothetical protein [Jiella sp. M17.18]|uniref:hypothetical protein n=1 Tax=Jiella sp. M17.18 TaxID=3234247 RepID=UPI0034DFC621